MVSTARTATAAGSGGKASAALLTKWVVIGASTGAVVASAVTLPLRAVLDDRARSSAEAPAYAPLVSHARPAIAPSQAAIEPPLPIPAQSPSLVVKPATTDAAQVTARTSTPGSVNGALPRGNSASPSGLRAEVVSLDQASQALRRHDPSGALAALDAYDARFPGGNLGPEATTLRVQALLEEGDRSRAERIANAFLTRSPHSPHAERLRSLLSGRSPH